MSETAPEILPGFPRQTPPLASNSLVNMVVKRAISESVSEAHGQKTGPRDEYIAKIVDGVMARLGDGAISANIESIAREFPSQYVAIVPRTKTSLEYVDRSDFKSFSHPEVLSPLLAIEIGGRRCYVGTDKLGHMIQQGYSYWLIYKIIESKRPGLGELYAKSWGFWTEGEDPTKEYIREYLSSKGMESDDTYIDSIQKDIVRFFTESDEIKIMDPEPDFVKKSSFLSNLAHLLGLHKKGILGTESSGIFSYADIAANEAGFKFYLDLEKNPESFAQDFDIAKYATCDWDEEVLKPKFTPLLQKRLKEAAIGRKPVNYSPGLDVSYDVPNNMFGISTPLFFYSYGDKEFRARIGGGLKLTSDMGDLKDESQVLFAADYLFRFYNLFYLFLSAQIGTTIEGRISPLFYAGSEMFTFGRGSLRLMGGYDPINKLPSAGLGLLWMF